MLQKFVAEARLSFITHPLTWCLFALFLFVEYSNYQKGVTITRLCELTGNHEAGWAHPVTDKQELDTICVDHRGTDD
ncbi:hypothetical protein CK489_39625 [Bradyrhizobium sp. UFLA03-84]|uniref:hypothetical protein n=1 Tax=Bradyrhizobium sp. UFLA03-84 TaxID=418599 RepID=UPI000BAE3755|nr:hypothetical protein [Bradyrhizobium sp. UFLA03-84]PAY03368.1 hypothetical protein CK489_39625 [Bradyrhizobium sp. UFLA03-84]